MEVNPKDKMYGNVHKIIIHNFSSQDITGTVCYDDNIYESNVMTLDDCLSIAKKDFGFKYGDGIIIVISELGLSGEVYMYGNNGEAWVKHGTTQGYA